jgi:hypothetical protein
MLFMSCVSVVGWSDYHCYLCHVLMGQKTWSVQFDMEDVEKPVQKTKMVAFYFSFLT